MPTLSRVVEVFAEKDSTSKRGITFISGTSLRINEAQGGFEVYGRLRKKYKNSSSIIDHTFNISSSTLQESSISRKTLTRADLRFLQLESVLCDNSVFSQDIDKSGNHSVHEGGRFEIVKIIATGSYSDDGDTSSDQSLVKSMSLEFVVPLAKEVRKYNKGNGEEHSLYSTHYKDVRSGHEEVCLLRGSVSFHDDYIDTDEVCEYELLVDGIDLISLDLALNSLFSLTGYSDSSLYASVPPILVGDHSEASQKLSRTNPLVLMVALFLLKVWFLIAMLVTTIPDFLLSDLFLYAEMAIGVEVKEVAKPVMCDSITRENMLIRSIHEHKQSPVYEITLFPPSNYGRDALKFTQIAWTLTLLTSIVAAIASLVWDIWSYRCAQSEIIDHKRPERQMLTMLVHAYNSWGFCGAVEEGMAMPFYGMPSTFVQAFHDGSPALAINAASVPLTIGLIIWRMLKLPWSIFKRLNKPFCIGLPSAKERPPFIASDMYTLIADKSSRSGLICGFLSQRKQFGCISLDSSYSTCLIRCTCDGVVVSSGKTGDSGVITTDWVWIEAVPDIDVYDPLAMYMDAAGVINGALLSPPCYCHPPHPHFSSSSPTPLLVPNIAGSASAPTISRVEDVGYERLTPGKSATPGLQTAQKRNDADKPSIKISPSAPPSGWCSWYHFFEKVTEADLVENIALMRDLKERNHLHTSRQGFSLFQVDDGYQRAWGDWLVLDQKKFPSKSLSTVVDLIQGAGMTAGLWLAPFSCDKHSLVAKKYPQWILRNQRGVPANSANCGKFFYGLDTTHPGVRDYLKVVLSTMTKTWGFSYLKLDFLYSAILPDAFENLHDRTKTRAQVLAEAMSMIAETIEEGGQDVYLLGCGSPLGAMIGHVHANRVSPDAGLAWLPEFPLPWWDRWNLPSARGMLRNTLSRLSQHGRWWCNDPDCMLLRTTTTFTETEIVSILTIKAMSGGSFILSDDLSQVPPHRIRLAQQVLPATNLAAVPLDIMDMGIPERLRLPLGRGSEKERSGRGMDAALGLGLWTLFAACHWDEDNRYDHYDPQPILSGSSRKSRSNPFSWAMLEKKTHRVSLRELLGPHSSHLEAIRRKFSRCNPNPNTQERCEPSGIVLFLYDFWGHACHTVDIMPSTLQAGLDLGAVTLVLPPVERRGVRLLAIRAAGVLSGSGVGMCATRDSTKSQGKGDKGRRPTVFTHRPSVAGLSSELQNQPIEGDKGSPSDLIEHALKSTNGEVLYTNIPDSDNESDSTEHTSQLDDDEDTEGGYGSEETVGVEEPGEWIAGRPLYLGSNLHFSCGLELAEMIVLHRDSNNGTADVKTDDRDGMDNEADRVERRRYKDGDANPREGAEDHGNPHEEGISRGDYQDQDRSDRQGQCCVLTFHEGMIRSRSWGGFFLILMPVPATAVEGFHVTACSVPASKASIQRQCVGDGISSPHKELHDKTRTDKYLGVETSPGGERSLPAGDVEVVKHCAAGTILKISVGDDETEDLTSHYGPEPHGRAHWATRVLIHY